MRWPVLSLCIVSRHRYISNSAFLSVKYCTGHIAAKRYLNRCLKQAFVLNFPSFGYKQNKLCSLQRYRTVRQLSELLLGGLTHL